jgi:hypothetical protein
MPNTNQEIDFYNFNLIFQKLDEAKKEQDANVIVCLQETSETSETIALFKEYQESLIQGSYSNFTTT